MIVRVMSVVFAAYRLRGVVRLVKCLAMIVHWVRLDPFRQCMAKADKLITRFCQFGENAHMYFICIACLNGSERLHRNNNVQWTAEHGVRLFKFFINKRVSLILIFFGDSYCRTEGSIMTRFHAPKKLFSLPLSPFLLHGTSTVSILLSVFLIGSFLFSFSIRWTLMIYVSPSRAKVWHHNFAKDFALYPDKLHVILFLIYNFSSASNGFIGSDDRTGLQSPQIYPNRVSVPWPDKGAVWHKREKRPSILWFRLRNAYCPRPFKFFPYKWLWIPGTILNIDMSHPPSGKQLKKSRLLRPFKGLFSRPNQSPSHQSDNASASISASSTNDATSTPK